MRRLDLVLILTDQQQMTTSKLVQVPHPQVSSTTTVSRIAPGVKVANRVYQTLSMGLCPKECSC